MIVCQTRTKMELYEEYDVESLKIMIEGFVILRDKKIDSIDSEIGRLKELIARKLSKKRTHTHFHAASKRAKPDCTHVFGEPIIEKKKGKIEMIYTCLQCGFQDVFEEHMDVRAPDPPKVDRLL